MSHAPNPETRTDVRSAVDADALNALWLGSVVLTYDGLAWQSHSSAYGVASWTNTEDGYTGSLKTSAELLITNLGRPLTIIYDVEAQQ